MRPPANPLPVALAILAVTFLMLEAGGAAAQAAPPVDFRDVPLRATSDPAPIPPPPPYVAPYPFTAEVAPEDSLRMALDARRDELRRLRREGRPDYYIRRRVLGFVAIGAGSLSAGLSTLAAFLLCSANRCALDRDAKAALWVGVGAGLAVTGVGIWAVTSAQRDNLNHDRIVELDAELGTLKSLLKQARRERKRARSYSLLPLLEGRSTALLQLTLRF